MKDASEGCFLARKCCKTLANRKGAQPDPFLIINPMGDFLINANNKLAVALAVLFAALTTWSSPTTSIGQPPQENEPGRWAYPAIAESISIRDGRTHEVVTWQAMIGELTKADVVFLGETHNDDTTHRLEHAVYEGVLRGRDGRAVLAMEMFERDVQPMLDDYLSGKIDEAAFLAHSRPWGNYGEAYRPMVETAREAGAPVVASNFPRPLRMKVMQSGRQALEELGENRHWAPETLLPNSDAYWKRTDNAVRGHIGMMGGDNSPEGRLLSTQSLWDNTMGESCVRALKAHPGYSVVHVNGGFHSEYWDGTAGQVLKRMPDAKVKTISIVPAAHPGTATVEGAPVADYVVFVENTAKNLNDGTWGVVVSQEQKFLLHMPPSASFEHPAPLLICLGDNGLSAQDSLDYWTRVLGDEVAVVALDATYRQQQPDLSMGGQWFWPETFSEDIGTAVGAVQGTWQYVLNRYPVDAGRVCLLGEGHGATVATAVGLLTDRMDIAAIAVRPRQYNKLKDFPLPLLEDWGDEQPPRRSIAVMGTEPDTEWWAGELTEYRSVGIRAEFMTANSDAWQADREIHQAIRKGLGLPAVEFGAERSCVVMRDRSPRAAHWARQLAQQHSTESVHCIVWDRDGDPPANTSEVLADVSIDVARDGGLPLCPGPFGGTTIVVLPGGTAGAELEQWLSLEQDDPLTRRSRFHRLRIATMDAGERGLPAVLEKLKTENRKNVLVVPSAFYAGGEVMRSLSAAVEPFMDQMTIQFLPGLGGRSGN
jgi:uncharacterized iron-regulated protein